MLQLLKKYIDEAKEAANLETLESVRLSAMGKSGAITQALKALGKLTPDERKTQGAEINKVKEAFLEAWSARKLALEEQELQKRLFENPVDVSLPPVMTRVGRIHPTSKVIDEVVQIFSQLGFTLEEGPHIETGYNNFTALNIPEHHPARQMHDTFYLPAQDANDETLLRTHTSSVQIRTMQKQKPPIKIIVPGKTFRSDSDQTHTPMFHQIEGLYVDKHVTFQDLKGCLSEFLKAFFELEELPMRFRPSFFPFTEPSAEADIGCKRTAEGVEIGMGLDWLEILGCGMVHPNVLENCGIDSTEYTAYAFGMGVERLAMLKYGTPDLRAFFEGGQRWSQQYGFNPY